MPWIGLEFIFKNTCNGRKPRIVHAPFVMSNIRYCVTVSMKFFFGWNPIQFSSHERISYQKVWTLVKKSGLWHAFFFDMKPNTKIKSLLGEMTKKSPDFSQKVWLLVERNGGYKWLLFFLSGLRPCQDFFTMVKGLGGGTGRGRLSPQGRGSVRKWAVFEWKQQGERPFSSCDSLALLYYTFLAPLWPVCLWLRLSFPCFCQSDRTLWSVSLWDCGN